MVELLKTEIAKLEKAYKKHDPDSKFRLDISGGYISIENLSGYNSVFNCHAEELPGCCGALVIHDFDVDEEDNADIWTMGLRLAEEYAREHRYSMIIATHLKKNKAYQEAIKSRKWEEASDFKNRRTSNEVTINVKRIK